MRAAVVQRYGSPEVVEIVDVPRPRPTATQVLVRVDAAAVTAGDARIRGARFPPGFGALARLALGLRRPRRPILGGTFAGTVVEVGGSVTRWSPDDRVGGMTGTRMGTHAEFIAVPADRLVAVPEGVSQDAAAGVLFGGTTALQFLNHKVEVAPGSTVLVNGASGAVGTNAVQLARNFGATVTAVTSGTNAALVRSLGADRVIDHTTTDVTATGDRYDIVFDAVGNLSIATGRPLLRSGGSLLLAVAGLGETIRARGDVVAGPISERPEDWAQLFGLIADGRLEVVIDGVLPLDDIVEAHRRVDSGRKVGNLIVHP